MYVCHMIFIQKFYLYAYIFRRIASERGIDVLELNRRNDTSIDKLVDS